MMLQQSNKPVVAFLKSKIDQKGGIEKYTGRLAAAFAKAGCKTLLLTTGNANSFGAEYEVISVGKNNKISVLHISNFDKECRRWLSRNPVDVVFGMDRNSYQTHYRAGNGVHAEYLKIRTKNDPWWKRCSFRWNPLHRHILHLERQTFESPHLQTLFCNSYMVKNEILQHYTLPSSKIEVVHNGVEWKELEHDFTQWPLRRQEAIEALGLDSSAFQYLFVGKGYRRKGLEILLKALETLPFRDFQLSVVGKDKNRQDFVQLAKKLGLGKKVKFFDERSCLTSFYQVADALVIPSTYDPFANVTIEALAMGLYVVTSKQNGGHEILSADCGCVIEDIYDIDSVKSALLSAIDNPKTIAGSKRIREGVAQLDFGIQLQKIVKRTLSAV